MLIWSCAGADTNFELAAARDSRIPAPTRSICYCVCGTICQTYHYPHLFSFAPEARREISRWWNHRKARHYCLCAPAGARDRSAVEEISLFRVPSSTPAGVRCIGARFPVVPPPANIHCPFRAKSRNRRTRKMRVMTSLPNCPTITGRLRRFVRTLYAITFLLNDRCAKLQRMRRCAVEGAQLLL